MLQWWLNAAGHGAGDWEAYWAARKDRTWCASWFLARLQRVGQGAREWNERRAPMVRALRKELEALPAVERDWTLLWVIVQDDSMSDELLRHWATPSERLEAAKRLGSERLMELIRSKSISTDPDLSWEDPRTSSRRERLVEWVLQRAVKLLRAEDAAAVLAAGKNQTKPWHVIAAAELQPESARGLLRDRLEHLGREPTPEAWDRAELAAALWRAVGESELDYLADWFFGEKVEKHIHATQTELFLERIKEARAPANRKLVERLITDKRLNKLDHQSLRALVFVVNDWTRKPVIEPAELWPNWEKHTQWPETAADERILDEWREKLRGSVESWRRGRGR
jgi:hypothetical protein